MTTTAAAIIYEIDDINSIALFSDLFAKRIEICNSLDRMRDVIFNRPDKAIPARILVTGKLAGVYKEWLTLMN